MFEFKYDDAETLTDEEDKRIAERLEKAVNRKYARGGIVKAEGDDDMEYTLERGEVIQPLDELAEAIRRSYETGDRPEDEEDDRVISINEEDPINSPSHYQLEGLDVEVIDVIVAVLTPEELAGYCRGNVIKYMLRASQKGGRKDYLKAEKYLGWLIDLT